MGGWQVGCHLLMRLFHKSANEKRMVVILPTERYQDWLEAPVQYSTEFLRPIAADGLGTMLTTTNRDGEAASTQFLADLR